MSSKAAAIAVTRFGLGARLSDSTSGELARINSDPKGWLREQLTSPIPTAGSTTRQHSPGSRELLEGLHRSGVFGGARRRDMSKADRRQARQAARKNMRRIYLHQAATWIRTATESQTPFTERLVRFWANHFSVSANKPLTRALAATLEAEAIRPNLFGSFSALLIAVESHPAMLAYLDNQWSVGPGSAAATRFNTRRANSKRKRQLGINENLAREILELHTLGSDGGYTQQDVSELALAITGWSIGGLHQRLAKRPVGSSAFYPELHQPGARRVLGRNYSEGGREQGVAILEDLAHHSSTARHISGKLAAHFSADTPSEALVLRLQNRFLKTRGNLVDLYEQLIDTPQMWLEEQHKLKTPQEFLISAIRATSIEIKQDKRISAILRTLGQQPFRADSPAGWPDSTTHWGNGDALLKRIEVADVIARRAGARLDPRAIAESALGPLLNTQTRREIARAQDPAQGLTLLLASPEFQRR